VRSSADCGAVVSVRHAVSRSCGSLVVTAIKDFASARLGGRVILVHGPSDQTWASDIYDLRSAAYGFCFLRISTQFVMCHSVA
jgi:hypothetical protein